MQLDAALEVGGRREGVAGDGLCAWSTSVLLHEGGRWLSSRTAERCSRCARARLASCCADRTCKRIESISERARSERESARRTALPAAHFKPSHCERAGTGSARSTLWRRKQSRRQGEQSAHLGERKGRATRPRAGERRVLHLTVHRVPPMLELATSEVAGTLTCAPDLVRRCVEVAQGGLCVEAVEIATAALVAARHAAGEQGARKRTSTQQTTTGLGLQAPDYPRRRTQRRRRTLERVSQYQGKATSSRDREEGQGCSSTRRKSTTSGEDKRTKRRDRAPPCAHRPAACAARAYTAPCLVDRPCGYARRSSSFLRSWYRPSAYPPATRPMSASVMRPAARAPLLMPLEGAVLPIECEDCVRGGTCIRQLASAGRRRRRRGAHRRRRERSLRLLEAEDLDAVRAGDEDWLNVESFARHVVRAERERRKERQAKVGSDGEQPPRRTGTSADRQRELEETERREHQPIEPRREARSARGAEEHLSAARTASCTRANIKCPCTATTTK